jgi:peptide/nickel transport system permease protein
MDYGPSYYRFPIKVFDLVISALPWTLSLIIPVPIIGFLVGNWIGSRIALNKDSKLNKVLFYGSLYTSLLPYYWFALILVFIFAITFRWFPICGAYSSKWVAPVLNFEFFLDATLHWILPFLSLASIGIGGWAMGMRASISYQLQSMYIDYTKRLGFSQDKLRRYMQRVAILPNFTWLPMSFASLVSQTMLVEVVFGYPGLGTLMYQAALSADYPLLEATFMITMIIVLIGNFLCDMIYGILDPTIGSRYVEESAG